MHADGGDGNQLPDFIQVPAKRCVGFVGIPAGQGQVFIMVPDFMAEPVNFPDDGFIIAFRDDPEIVAPLMPVSCSSCAVASELAGKRSTSCRRITVFLPDTSVWLESGVKEKPPVRKAERRTRRVGGVKSGIFQIFTRTL